jgi:hypothetical protein
MKKQHGRGSRDRGTVIAYRQAAHIQTCVSGIRVAPVVRLVSQEQESNQSPNTPPSCP